MAKIHWVAILHQGSLYISKMFSSSSATWIHYSNLIWLASRWKSWQIDSCNLISKKPSARSTSRYSRRRLNISIIMKWQPFTSSTGLRLVMLCKQKSVCIRSMNSSNSHQKKNSTILKTKAYRRKLMLKLLLILILKCGLETKWAISMTPKQTQLSTQCKIVPT